MTFKGDKKVGRSLLAGPEEKLKQWLLPKVPKSVETYHLTASTLAWSTLIIVFSFLAQYNPHWLWGASLMIVLQYLTDLLDGAVGRERNTGLIKWGYYMDHFLDYIFLCSILIGYAFLVEDNQKYMLFYIIALFGAFMVNSFLAFAATNEFKISYLGIGPTEVRLIFIVINTTLIFQRPFFVRALPYVLWGSTFGLFVTVYQTQKAIWYVDMKARHGDNYRPESLSRNTVTTATGTVCPQSIFGWLSLSWIMAFAALAILMTRPFAPYHRYVALAIYLASWLPFIQSFRKTYHIFHAEAERLREMLRHYAPHIVMAVVLIAAGYVGNVLVPGDTMPPPKNLRRSIAEDSRVLCRLDNNMKSLLQWSHKENIFSGATESLENRKLIKKTWEQFRTTVMELDILKHRYEGFHLVNALSNPSGHADAFVLAYGALVSQLLSTLNFLEQVGGNTFIEAMLNEPDPDANLPANSYDEMKQKATHPKEWLRLSAGRLYLELIRNDITLDQAFVSALEDKVSAIYESVISQPEVLVTRPRDILEKAVFTAWFPLQKEVARQMSLTRPVMRDSFITVDQILSYRSRMRPGDIILERRNWQMSNLGIPGFWPHVAFYIGTTRELDSYFADLPVLGGETPSAYIEKKHPSAFRTYQSPDNHGYTRCIIEALQDGSVFTSLEVGGTADYLAVLRPIASKEQKFQAILNAFDNAGKPYDYNFDFATDLSLVCSELVCKAYEPTGSLKMTPPMVNGRRVVPPNQFAEEFDRNFNKEEQQMEFVLFLDGSEKDRKATEKSVDEFRKTWKRPKWEIMQE